MGGESASAISSLVKDMNLQLENEWKSSAKASLVLILLYESMKKERNSRIKAVQMNIFKG